MRAPAILFYAFAALGARLRRLLDHALGEETEKQRKKLNM